MNQKKMAAEKAMEYVKSDMVIGLGTGTTVFYFLEALGMAVKQGLNVVGVCSSEQTERIATEFGIPLCNVEQVKTIDLVVDGVDEINPDFNAIKGGGGALLREKILAKRAVEVIWIMDESKLVKKLGEKNLLPIEIIPYGHKYLLNYLNECYGLAKLRKNGEDIYITDNGNYVIDLKLDINKNNDILEKELLLVPGIVEVGIFSKMCDRIIIGKENLCEVVECMRTEKWI